MIKLFATDVDNTLFDYRIGVHQANIKALIELQQSGVRVALASGRSAIAMASLVRILDLEKYGGYLVACNGAHVIRLQDNHVVHHDTHSVEALHRFIEAAEILGVSYYLEQKGVLLYSDENKDVFYEKEHCGQTIRRLTDWRSEIKEPTSKLMLGLDNESDGKPLNRFFELFSNEVSCERHGLHAADVVPFNNSKLSGIQRLITESGWTLDEVAAIGDGENDRMMLSRVGLSACPNNASKDIRKITDLVVASAYDGGVASFANLVMSKNSV